MWRFPCGLPTHPCQRFDQSGAFNSKVTAYGSFGHTTVQCGDDGVQLLSNDGARATAHPSAPLSGLQARNDPFPYQRSLILGQRPKYMKQQFAGRRRCIHTLSERTEGHLFVFQRIDDG